MIDAVSARMERELPDPEWAGRAQADITARAEEAMPAGATLQAAHCRKSLCRLQIQFESVEARDEAGAGLSLLIPWAGEAAFHADPQDPSKVIVYAGREGSILFPAND